MNELEFVLNKIIDIDNRANQVEKETMEKIKQEDKKLQDKLKSLQETCYIEAQDNMNEEYHEQMEKAKSKAKAIREDSKMECQIIEERFQGIKESLKKEIIKEIINNN